MHKKTFIRKRNPYSSLITLGMASALLTIPVLADSAVDDRQHQQAGTSVTVDESAPQVRLEQPAPKVTAQQQETQVRVETGEPEISVEQPEPEVSINQPDPEVSVEQAEPQITVNDAKPEVEVNQAEPEITVNSAEPEIQIINMDAEGNRKEGKQSGASQSLAQIELNELKGKDVVTSAGEELGSVKDIVATPQGQQAGFVVSVGGFFGIGDTEILVPASEAQLRDDKIVWQTPQSQDQLEKTHEFRAEHYESLTERYNTLQEAQEAEVSARSLQ